ncbi:MAG: hypothetical protein ACI4F6_02545 [Acutalibacteraceae bacterium]
MIMYDFGENDAAIQEVIQKQKQKKEQRKYQRKQSVQSIYDTYKEIKAKVAQLKEKGTVDSKKFTGKFTDIAQVDNMNCADVKNYCQNEEIYKATQQNILKARDEGYLTIDENKDIHLTDKGRELIQSESFQKQFEQDQLNQSKQELNNQNQDYAYVEFKGNEQDMGVFNYSEQVDINAIKDSPQKEAVLNKFSELEKQGMVNIKDGVISPTETGREFAKTQELQIKQATNTEISSVLGDIDADGVPNRIDSQYSYLDPAQGNVAQKTYATTAKAASEATAKTASSTGAKAAGTATKTAGTVGAKAAGTATKTAGTVGAKAAGTAATGAAAVGTGAATAGVGAVVVVAASALTQALKQAKNAVVQSLRN